MPGESIKAPIISLVFVGVGNYLFYLYGYRNFTVVDMQFFALLVFGWMSFFTTLSSLFEQRKGTPPVNEKPVGKKKWDGCLVLFFFILFFISNLAVTIILADNRTENILATQQTKQTMATVVDIKERHFRGSSTAYPIIHYQVNNEMLTQQLSSSYNGVKIGDQLTIKYSVEYPHMVKVVE
jgi:hypothetical protein